jgi:hypothetical protein
MVTVPACRYAVRKANLLIQHGFQLEGGRLRPLTWMAAARDIAAGEVGVDMLA